MQKWQCNGDCAAIIASNANIEYFRMMLGTSMIVRARFNRKRDFFSYNHEWIKEKETILRQLNDWVVSLSMSHEFFKMATASACMQLEDLFSVVLLIHSDLPQ